MEKIARLCWNTNEWRRPSGRKGKSKSNDAYENEMGFGHEEWLLDDSKIMPDGYHYGFLEPMRVKSDKHFGKVYDIYLFTISPNKQKVYIGCLSAHRNRPFCVPNYLAEILKMHMMQQVILKLRNNVSGN